MSPVRMFSSPNSTPDTVHPLDSALPLYFTLCIHFRVVFTSFPFRVVLFQLLYGVYVHFWMYQ